MILLVYSFLEGYLEDLAFICTKQFSDNIKDKILGINIDIERSKAQIENLSKCSFNAYEKNGGRYTYTGKSGIVFCIIIQILLE